MFPPNAALPVILPAALRPAQTCHHKSVAMPHGAPQHVLQALFSTVSGVHELPIPGSLTSLLHVLPSCFPSVVCMCSPLAPQRRRPLGSISAWLMRL